MDYGILIPAYQPTPQLVDLVDHLLRYDYPWIVVVDDGSGPNFAEIFQQLEERNRVTVLTHLINQGKGAALRTGINYISVHHPKTTGVVTADADGQHLPEDIERVAVKASERPEALILGVRQFRGTVPWRSAFGNTLTRRVYHFLVRAPLSDTQTGLRGIPRGLFPLLLSLPSNRYEYEMDMLIELRVRNTPFLEVPISTLYEDNNRNSHFRPLRDSLRIYAVFLRFILLSVTVAGIDFVVFTLSWYTTNNILGSMYLARAVAGTFQFLMCRSVVFRSQRSIVSSAIQYALLCATMGFISYVLLISGVEKLGGPVPLMKLLAEGVLFICNFAIQRTLIFASPERTSSSPSVEETCSGGASHRSPSSEATEP